MDYLDFLGEITCDSLVIQSTKEWGESGILILPIYCLFLSMHGFLCIFM